MQFLLLDSILLSIFLLVTLFIGLQGFRNSSATTNVSEYALANRQMNNMHIAITMIATLVGNATISGISAEIFRIGILFPISALFFTSSALIVIMKFIAPKISQERYKNAVSVADIIGYHYGKSFEIFSGICTCVHAIGIIAAQIIAIGYLFMHFIAYDTSVILFSTIIITYSTFGGVRSVVLTDVIQFALIISIMPLVAFFAMQETAGATAVLSAIYQDFFTVLDWHTRTDYILYCISFSMPFFWLVPPMIQRFLMQSKHSSTCIKYLLGVYIFFFIISTIFAFSARVALPNVEMNAIVSELISKSGFVMQSLGSIAMLAAIMSTMDSYLNTAAIVVIRNIIKPIVIRHDSANEVFFMKIATILIGIIAVVIALKDFPILPLIAFSGSIWAAFVSIPLCFAVIGMKVTKECYISSVIMGVYMYSISYFNQDLGYSYLTPFLGVMGGLIGFFVGYICVFYSKRYEQRYEQK